MSETLARSSHRTLTGVSARGPGMILAGPCIRRADRRHGLCAQEERWLHPGTLDPVCLLATARTVSPTDSSELPVPRPFQQRPPPGRPQSRSCRASYGLVGSDSLRPLLERRFCWCRARVVLTDPCVLVCPGVRQQFTERLFDLLAGGCAIEQVADWLERLRELLEAFGNGDVF